MSIIVGKLREWRDNPRQFVEEAIGAKPSSQQKDALEAFPHSKRMSIRSGHGTGKDATASWLIWLFMCTRPYSKVICTAPTGRQLNDILWSELSKWLRQSIFADEFVIQKDKIFHRDAPKEWWIRAVSVRAKASKEEQAETLAGFHGDHMLIVVDEASGVPDPVYIPLEGAMTQEDNKCLLIGNMTKNIGYFYDTHFNAAIRDKWTQLHWDSRKSTNVTPEMVEYFRTKYGENSNIFRIRVAGDPPLADDTTLIPLYAAQACIGNEVVEDEDDPLYLGVDVARYGDDESIILPRRGLKILPWESFQGMNTIDVGGHVLLTYNELGASGIAVDEIGVGAGLTDWLYKVSRTSSLNAFGVNVAMASSNHMRYHRLRDELWWNVREKIMGLQYSLPYGEMGEELCNELASVTYSFDNNGAVVVESKRDMKKRGIKSPNIADAVGLTEYFYNIASSIFKQKQKQRKQNRPWEKQENTATLSGRYAWMAS